MQFQREFITEGYQEFDDLVKDYFARTRAKEGLPTLDINWSTLAKLEQENKFYLFSARHHQLDGFASYYVVQHVHHPTMLVAACDILAVRPEMRHMSIGKRLVEYAEFKLQPLGVTHMVHNFRVLYDTVPLFEKLGFVLHEKSYVKELN